MKAFSLIGLCIFLLPLVEAIQLVQVDHVALSEMSERFTWSTDEPGSSVVRYGETAAYGREIAEYAFTAEHTIALVSLIPGKTYYYEATSCTEQGNCDRDTGSFDALQIGEVHVTNVSAIGATINWTTNRAMFGSVKYGLDPNELDHDEPGEETTEHAIALDGLEGSTQYFYQIMVGETIKPVASFWTSSDYLIAWVTLDAPLPELTNEEWIDVRGSSEALGRLQIFINDGFTPSQIKVDGNLVWEYAVPPDGRFAFSIKLRNGDNKITFEHRDTALNKVRVDFFTTLDKDGPELDVDFPAATKSDHLVLQASVSQDATIEVFIDQNFQEAYCDDSCSSDAQPWCCRADQKKYTTEIACNAGCGESLSVYDTIEAKEGNFEIEILTLEEGEHNILVKATDEAGNEAIASGTVAVDSTSPRITGLRIEEVIYGFNEDGEFTSSGPADDTVHFQVITISGDVSEPAEVRIVNTGEFENLKWNFTEKQFFRRAGDTYQAGVYGAGIQGNGLDLFYDFDETVDTDADDHFQAEVILMHGQNYISIIAEDAAGNVNVRGNSDSPEGGTPQILRRVVYDGGSPFWVVGRHSVVPNFIVAGDMMKGDLPIGLMVRISPTIIDRSRLRIDSVDVSFPDRDRYDNKLMKTGGKVTEVWDESAQELFAYIPLKIARWQGADVNNIPDPLTFELKVAIHYTCEGCFMHEDLRGEQYVWVKESLDIDKPIDYARFLTPDMIDKLLGGIKDVNKAIDSTLDVVQPLTLANTLACVGFVGYNYFAKATGAPVDLEHQYLICDRVGCPSTPPNPPDVDFSFLGGNPAPNEPTDTVQFSDTSDPPIEYTFKHTGQHGRCPDNGYEVDITTNGPVSINIMGFPFTAMGEIDFAGKYLCTKETREDFVKNFQSVFNNQLAESKYYYYETEKNALSSYVPGQGGLDYHQTKCIVNYFDGDDTKATWGNVNPLSDLISSVGCACMTGTQSHLKNIQRVMGSLEKCFEQAKAGDVSVGYCENVLGMYTCDFVFWGLQKALKLNDDGSLNVGGGRSDARGRTDLITQGLRDRYPSQFAGQLGLGPSSLAHKACQFAVTQDWTAFSAEVSGVIESMPVAPQIMPLQSESRVYTYDPFTGRLTIKYLITPAIFSGGQHVEWQLNLSCVPGEPNDDYCGNRVVNFPVKSGVVAPNQQFLDYIEHWDPDSRFWYNKVKMHIKYRLGDQTVERDLTDSITHLGQMVEQCHLTTNDFGDAIGCDTIVPGDVGSVEMMDIRFTPGVDHAQGTQPFYIGNDINVLLKARKFNGFSDQNLLLVYYPAEQESAKKWVKFSSNDLDDNYANLHLFTVPSNIGNGQIIRMRIDSGPIIEKINEELKNSHRAEFIAKVDDGQPVNILKINGIERKTITGDPIDSFDITIQTTQESARVYMKQGDSEVFLVTASRSDASFPYDINHQFPMVFKLFKDVGNNGLGAEDFELQYAGGPQEKRLTFDIRDKSTCSESPRVEIIYPRPNSFCAEDPYIEITAWDDCNEEYINIDPGNEKLPQKDKSKGSYVITGIQIQDSMTITASIKDDPDQLTEDSQHSVTVGKGQGDCSREAVSSLKGQYSLAASEIAVLVLEEQAEEEEDDRPPVTTPQVEDDQPPQPAEVEKVSVLNNMCNNNFGLKCEERAADNYCKILGYIKVVSKTCDGFSSSNTRIGSWADGKKTPLIGPCGSSGSPQWVTELECQKRSDTPYFWSKIPERYPRNVENSFVIGRIRYLAQKYDVPLLLALSVIEKESEFIHCFKNTEHNTPSDDEYCSAPLLNTNNQDYGIMQINHIAHIDCLDPYNSRDDTSICKIDECNGDGVTAKTVDCNIAAGLNLLRRSYDLAENGKRIEGDCANTVDSAENTWGSYEGWDYALRVYNGKVCNVSQANDNYVALVREKAALFLEAST
ncbi:MAG: fibronectin type III domain-containing protein [Nanoarchaeota archaeon]